MVASEFNAGGNPAMDWYPIQGRVEIFLITSRLMTPNVLLGLYADFTKFMREEISHLFT